LGEKFFINTNNVNEKIFAKFLDYDGVDFESKPIYRLNNISELSDEAFKVAINTLYNTQ